jgi:hypothetical protein
MKFLVVFIIFTSTLKAQIDSAMSVPLVGINLAGNLPFADMAQRFGANLKAGGSFHYKTKKNWIFGFEFGYGFGRNQAIQDSTRGKCSAEEGKRRFPCQTGGNGQDR